MSGEYRSQIVKKCVKLGSGEIGSAGRIEQNQTFDMFEGFLRLLDARFAGCVLIIREEKGIK